MEKKPYPSETQERFIVRLPDGMRDQISAAAKKAGRSMNAEIVHRLQASFETDIEKIGRKLQATEFDAASGRINALGLAMVLKNLSDTLAPSLKDSDQPFAKTVLGAQKLAAQAAKTLLETADQDAEVIKRTTDALLSLGNKKASD